ncbi:MAG: hypothetical protein U1A73_04540 [Pseudomonas sp.]|nr:hypothetical protein [Pseudomonas sp.]
MSTPLIIVGSVVVAKAATAVCDIGEVGVCYEAYTLSGRAGYSMLFASGRYDGFSPDEVEEMLTVTDRVCAEVSGYHFRTVMQLERDWREGRFAPAFDEQEGGG